MHGLRCRDFCGHTAMRELPPAHYYDVDRELQHRGELVPTRNEIMGKIGTSMLLSYSGLVVSYVTRERPGFVRVLHSRVVVSSCSYIREIEKQSTRSPRAPCGQPALI